MSVHQLSLGVVPRSGLARLIAMRWWLNVFKSRGRPVFGVSEYARMAGLRPTELLLQLPRAGLDPILYYLRYEIGKVLPRNGVRYTTALDLPVA